MRATTLLLLLLAQLAGAGVARAISGGHPATGQEFGFVRLLVIAWEDGKASGCTGSMISPRLVLTAAHCVVRQDGVRPTGAEVRRSRSAQGFPARGFYVHSRYESGDPSNPVLLKNDLAVLDLAEAQPGPYAMTPFDYLWSKHKDVFMGVFKPLFLKEITVDQAKALLNEVLTRDPDGRPYAAQIGFGLYGCERDTKSCSEVGSTKARFIEKFISNLRTDRELVAPTCDQTPFTLELPIGNLICSGTTEQDTRTPTNHGPNRAYTAQPGDSGGPAVVFGQGGQAFVIGTMSFGNLEIKAVNMNLVEHLDFLRDIELGEGPSFRTVPFQ